ncbi:MAG: hypothetical protein VYC91_02650 [Acidobacteriota bacterium]|nr:hypothetical protein [Acidobacteriota bacterium]
MSDHPVSKIPTQRDPQYSDEMPVVPYRVLYADIPFYSDSECTQEVVAARIAILDALDPDDELKELDVVPSLNRYEPGQLVRWTLDNKNLWEESWYKNPETGQIERAWTLHVEFIGQVLSQQALDQNQETLKEIEAKLAAREKIN